MTSPGRHAATDGSFSKSAGSALFRGGGLVALAVLIGLILLYWVYDDDNQGGYTVGAGDSAVVDGGSSDGTDGTGDDGTDVSETSIPPEEDASTITVPTTVDAGAADDEDADDGPKPPEETTALAVNGVGTKGLAGKLQGELNTLNYKTDAANLSGTTTPTVIYFKAGFKPNARAIADSLGWPPSVIKKFPNDGSVVLSNDNARIDAADVILVIGADGTYQ